MSFASCFFTASSARVRAKFLLQCDDEVNLSRLVVVIIHSSPHEVVALRHIVVPHKIKEEEKKGGIVIRFDKSGR